MTETKDAGLPPAFVETVAGLSAGSTATLIVHPLDIVKTRMQGKTGAPLVLDGWEPPRCSKANGTDHP